MVCMVCKDHNSMYRFRHGIYWCCDGIVMVLPGANANADAELSTIVKEQQDVDNSAALRYQDDEGISD